MPAIGFLAVLALVAADPRPVVMPKAVDSRLTITLVAAEPDIVTPTGISIDDRGRVFVIESNTHFRPDNYVGPTSDRIRIFEDTNGDGKADKISTFYEGLKWTMGIQIAPDQSIYVATRYEVFRLRDTNNDGKADERTPIAKLETEGAYPHNGLSGFAVDIQGNLYFGLGENLGVAYKLVGSDGTTLPGGGEGGNIYRCRGDGTKLTRVATGFWNPFHMTFDAFGRLFAVDNDPDSRPPCRLLHIVENGDYGYRFRYGRKGVHPFIAWDGELPGTLPMVAGTGEAPSGVVAYESDGLPADFRGDLLATSWGDHRVDRFRLRERGASFRSAAEPIVTGGEDFRPVGIAVAPDGSVYISDWVDKSYPVHGGGRVWRISAKEKLPRETEVILAHPDRRIRENLARSIANSKGQDSNNLLRQALTDNNTRAKALAIEILFARNGVIPVDVLETVHRDKAPEIRALVARRAPNSDMLPKAGDLATDPSPLVRAEVYRRLRDPRALQLLREAAATPDPFLNQAAREGLKGSASPDDLAIMADDSEPRVRLAALLVARQSSDPIRLKLLDKALADPDATIRFAAIQWVGEEGLASYRPKLEAAVTTGAVSKLLFEGYLATLEALDGVVPQKNSNSDGQDRVAALVSNSKTPPAILKRAIRVLRPDHPTLTIARFETLLQASDLDVRTEAIRSLRDSRHGDRFRILSELARNKSLPENLRAEAIVGLAGGSDPILRDLLKLAASEHGAIRYEAIRSLRGAKIDEADQKRLATTFENDPEAANLLSTLNSESRQPAVPENAQAIDTWLARLKTPGDASSGERLFFHPKGPGCYNCHEIDGRGGKIGPELSATGRTLDTRRLVESIAFPSKEVAPAFVPWLIERADGTTTTGLLIGETIDGKQTYADATGKIFHIKPGEVSERRPHDKSIMPDGLLLRMTEREFRDLIAFLKSK